jgi:hypothetical protein
VRVYPTSLESTFVFLRMIHIALMVSMAVYVLMIRLVPAQTGNPLNPKVLWALCVVAGGDLAIGQWMRSKQLGMAFKTLRSKPDDPSGLRRLLIGVLIADCLAE